MVKAVEKAVHSVPKTAFRRDCRFNIVGVLNSVVDDANMTALHSHIKELQVEKKDWISSRARNRKGLMDTLLRIVAEKKIIVVLGLGVERLTPTRTWARSEMENSAVNNAGYG